MSQNIQLTPIQTDYKVLLENTKKVEQDALRRIAQIDKEIQSLYNEQIKLQEIVVITTKFDMQNEH